MESVEILVNGFIVRNGRTKNGLRKDCIIEEIKSSTIPLIYKKSLLYYVEKANDERKDIEEMLKKYMKEFNSSHGQAKRVAMFEKVSFEQFYKDYMNCLSDAEKESIAEETIKDIYDNIKIPKRSTKGSAGYDFFAPVDMTIKPGNTMFIPTGIRCCMVDNWVLKIYPRSGLGFKFRLQLNNTVGIIDADYYGSSNEGHIMAKITNDTNEDKTVSIEAGKGFMQGIFVEYGIAFDDEADGIRDGGFGSTDK